MTAHTPPTYIQKRARIHTEALSGRSAAAAAASQQPAEKVKQLPGRLMMLHGGRESEASTKCDRGAGYLQKHMGFSMHLFGLSGEAQRNPLKK